MLLHYGPVTRSFERARGEYWCGEVRIGSRASAFAIDRRPRLPLHTVCDRDPAAAQYDASGHKRSFRLQATRVPVAARPVAARQGDDELGEGPRFGLDIDPAAMLFDNDVMGH